MTGTYIDFSMPTTWNVASFRLSISGTENATRVRTSKVVGRQSQSEEGHSYLLDPSTRQRAAFTEVKLTSDPSERRQGGVSCIATIKIFQ